jgi:hypothetical protein
MCNDTMVVTMMTYTSHDPERHSQTRHWKRRGLMLLQAATLCALIAILMTLRFVGDTRRLPVDAVEVLDWTLGKP